MELQQWSLLLGGLVEHKRAVPLTIGVIGGSISHGEYVGAGQDYPSLLSGTGVRVLNRAIPATGVAMASFCLDELLPPTAELDALVIEYAVNDGHFQRWHTETLLNGASGQEQLAPIGSMERLARHVRLTRPQTMPLILYMCDPQMKDACDGLYAPVARAYGIRELSLARTLGNQSALVSWQMQHPDATGHLAAAVTVARALTGLRDVHGHKPQPVRSILPADCPCHLPSWEADRRWRCSTCDWYGCEQLQPLQRTGDAPRADGFEVHTYQRSGGRAPSVDGVVIEQSLKAGWASTRPGAQIAFDVPEASRVLVAFLCSYESVGEAQVELAPLRNASPRLAARSWWRSVQLRWSQPSSQQCIFNAGDTTAPSELRVRVAPSSSAGAQVKVFGVYRQPLGTESMKAASVEPIVHNGRRGLDTGLIILLRGLAFRSGGRAPQFRSGALSTGGTIGTQLWALRSLKQNAIESATSAGWTVTLAMDVVVPSHRVQEWRAACSQARVFEKVARVLERISPAYRHDFQSSSILDGVEWLAGQAPDEFAMRGALLLMRVDLVLRQPLPLPRPPDSDSRPIVPFAYVESNKDGGCTKQYADTIIYVPTQGYEPFKRLLTSRKSNSLHALAAAFNNDVRLFAPDANAEADASVHWNPLYSMIGRPEAKTIALQPNCSNVGGGRFSDKG